MRKILITLFFTAILKWGVNSQISVDTYLWQYPLQRDLVIDETLILQIREEIQKVIDLGSLALRPINCRYSDVMYDHYALYKEPGRILQTVALAYPYLLPSQQDSIRNMVMTLFQNTNHRPWATVPIAENDGIVREFFTSDDVWGLNSNFGQYRPTIQSVYSIWLYLYRTGDTLTVQPYYSNIKNFYNNKVAGGVDPGNLYGSMSAHIGMARLAHIFGDTAQVVIARNNLQNYLNNSTNINVVDQRASNGLNGWQAPYAREYDARTDNWIYRGFIFLNLSPEIGRYLQDEVYQGVLERHNYGLQRYPFWYLRQAQYFTRWTGDEGVGIPSEIMGMIMPIERWVLNTDFETLAGYMISAPLGIGDCYWIESAILALESNATDQWVDVRNTPFELDILTGLIIWTGSFSTDWANPNNWDIGRIPTANDNVIIPQTNNSPIIEANVIGYAKNISIQTGATLIVRGTLYTD